MGIGGGGGAGYPILGGPNIFSTYSNGNFFFFFFARVEAPPSHYVAPPLTPLLILPSSVNSLSYCSFPPRSFSPLRPTLSSSPLRPLIPPLNLPLNCWICPDFLSLLLISHSLLIFRRNIVHRAKGKLQIVQLPNPASNKSISI